LESVCRSAIVTVGFLPEIGFVHEVAPSKLPLAYDMQEPFRLLVDLSVIELLTDSKVDRKADFIVTENFHIRLRPAAATAIMERLSASMNRKVSVGGRSFSDEGLVTESARRLARCLTGEKSDFKIGYPFEVGESGHVDSDIARNVASMSYAEARTLGISVV
jgi:CRISP-associated protein Cas1